MKDRMQNSSKLVTKSSIPVDSQCRLYISRCYHLVFSIITSSSSATPNIQLPITPKKN